MRKMKIIIALLILTIALGFVSYVNAIYEPVVYLPFVMGERAELMSTPIMRLTPTLAPTMTVFPPQEIEICIPGPCE